MFIFRAFDLCRLKNASPHLAMASRPVPNSFLFHTEGNSDLKIKLALIASGFEQPHFTETQGAGMQGCIP
jgi:hypothetical protein